MTDDMKTTVRDRYASHAHDPEVTSLGFGDPVTLARLRPGETVLDLGSGKGGDLVSASQAVGPNGRAIGVDMTPEMLDEARAATTDLANVSVRQGDLEALPLPCGSVDVVISNCVINLTSDKRRALSEAYRALTPGGRLVVSDTAFETEPPEEVRTDPEAWSCCVGGALVASDYEALLAEIGFEDVALDFAEGGCTSGCSTGEVTARAVMVTARKPGEPGTPIRPAVPTDEVAHTDHAFVALDGDDVVGSVAIDGNRVLYLEAEQRGTEIETRLLFAALEVARWSGETDVVLGTPESSFGFFERVGFRPVSKQRAGTTEGSAMRLDFEDADLPSLGRPTLKSLPMFDGGSCC